VPNAPEYVKKYTIGQYLTPMAGAEGFDHRAVSRSDIIEKPMDDFRLDPVADDKVASDAGHFFQQRRADRPSLDGEAPSKSKLGLA
jgi:hypothetical protein